MGLLALVTLAMVNTIFWSEGRVDRADLAAVSPFLSSGQRSDQARHINEILDGFQ